MTFPAMPDPTGDRERHDVRWSSNRETLELATAGAARVLGHDHRAARGLAKAAITMDKANLWRVRLAVKNLRREQREA